MSSALYRRVIGPYHQLRALGQELFVDRKMLTAAVQRFARERARGQRFRGRLLHELVLPGYSQQPRTSRGSA